MDIRDLLVILREPSSPVAESIRSMRTNLQRHLASGVRGLMIISPWGGDGKSTVCANLAASLSQLFIDVILVDADLRKPTLTRVFQAEDRPGLTDCLEETHTLDDVLLGTSVDRLRFVPAGQSPLNPADLLGRHGLASLLADLKNRCQCLIVDTSPLTACGDALLIGAHLDRALMVISPKNWQGDAEARVKDLLEDHSIQVLGVILNGDEDPDASSNYGYGYGYGYGQKPGEGRAGGRSRGPSDNLLRRLWNRWRPQGRGG